MFAQITIKIHIKINEGLTFREHTVIFFKLTLTELLINPKISLKIKLLEKVEFNLSLL